MDHFYQYAETIEINGNYVEEQRSRRDRRKKFSTQKSTRYERRLGKQRRYSLSVDIEV